MTGNGCIIPSARRRGMACRRRRLPARGIALSILFLLLFAHPHGAQAFLGPELLARQAAAPGIEAQVDAYLQPLVDADLISGSVLIARDGEILLAKGYGLANREYGMPNGPETKFRIGSITKQFTAMAVMQLARRGKRRLDDTLDTFLPGYPGGKRITVHHLLTHTSGIPNYNRLPEYAERMMLPRTPEEVVAWFQEKPLRFTPGEKQEYSNSGYVLLTVIIEKVSGATYEAYLQTNIFEPLGMKDSGQDSSMKVLTNRATGHVNPGGQVYQTFYRDMPFVSGDGALYSTVMDLHRWDRALYGEELLPRRLMDKLLTPQEGDYAYGWFVEQRFGRRLLSHRGTISGFLTDIQRFTDDEVLVVALFNYESSLARDVFHGLGAIALGQPFDSLLVGTAPPVDLALLRTYAGTYRIEPGFELTFTVEQDRLWMEGPNMGKLAAAPLSATRFLFQEMNALATFTPSADGTVEGLTLVSGARRFTCPRKE